MFRDAIRLFVTHLERAGVDTTSLEEPGMFHVFPILMPWAEGSRRAYRAVGEFVRAHLPDGGAGDTADVRSDRRWLRPSAAAAS